MEEKDTESREWTVYTVIVLDGVTQRVESLSYTPHKSLIRNRSNPGTFREVVSLVFSP